MQANQTNQIDLSNVEIDKLLTLLKKVENADTAQQAVWLPAGDREKVAEIRQKIETQSER